MKILIRLPNWLGDLIMSTAFIEALQNAYPDATIDVITKNQLVEVLEFFNCRCRVFTFSKKAYPGVFGSITFGKQIAQDDRYDLFITLPDSFSSALMGYYTRAKKRIGYKKEFRSIFLTHSFKKKSNIHRVEEYVNLLATLLGEKIAIPVPKLSTDNSQPSRGLPQKKYFIFNINSEAQSRRIPIETATEIANGLLVAYNYHLVLIGTEREKDYNEELIQKLSQSDRSLNYAGKTSLTELVQMCNGAEFMVSSDSGPAHVANALGTPLVVLFGAGNEKNTGPYNKNNVHIVRVPHIPCAPCLKNTCKLGEPECLLDIKYAMVSTAIKKLINQ